MKSHTLFAFALLLMCLALHASAQTPDGNSSVIVTRLQFKAETLTSYKGESRREPSNNFAVTNTVIRAAVI